jgi:hypothetical protein
LPSVCAYYGGTAPYVEALRAAARDGVDVRLLVPGASDIPVIQPFSRAGYRPLLEGGVRVYEWNGSMMHAKTAVADARWARVGSTNLNIASWLGNRELDVIIEHESFARQMEEMFLRDLDNATEFVLQRNRVRASGASSERRRPAMSGSSSGGRMVAGAVRVGNSGRRFELRETPSIDDLQRERSGRPRGQSTPFPATIRSFSTPKTPLTSRARTSAICRSAALSTTPSSIVRPFFTMM